MTAEVQNTAEYMDFSALSAFVADYYTDSENCRKFYEKYGKLTSTRKENNYAQYSFLQS